MTDSTRLTDRQFYKRDPLLKFLRDKLHLFRTFHVQVNPRHPDGSGGLATIGRLLVVSVLFATLIGATAVVMSMF